MKSYILKNHSRTYAYTYNVLSYTVLVITLLIGAVSNADPAPTPVFSAKGQLQGDAKLAGQLGLPLGKGTVQIFESGRKNLEREVVISIANRTVRLSTSNTNYSPQSADGGIEAVFDVNKDIQGTWSLRTYADPEVRSVEEVVPCSYFCTSSPSFKTSARSPSVCEGKLVLQKEALTQEQLIVLSLKNVATEKTVKFLAPRKMEKIVSEKAVTECLP